MNTEDLTARVIALDERVTRHTEQIKTCFSQISEIRDLTASVHKLATSVEVIGLEQKNMNGKMDRLAGDLEEIKEKPARRWDTVVTVAVTVIVTALVTFALTKIGL